MSLIIYQIYFTKWFRDHSYLHLIMQLTYLALPQRVFYYCPSLFKTTSDYYSLSFPVGYIFPKLAVKIHKFYAVHLTRVFDHRRRHQVSSKQGLSIIHFRF